uniref:Cornifelin homolog B-like n=1 Tax=Schistosoma mansoni TaxID=6183 RepID=A0A3Q0KMC6_SCHMA
MENSSPVVQQPTSIQRQTSEREWSSGLCACFDDLPTCCLVLFCPHCYMCYLYNKEGESCWIPVCGAGILPLRIKHRIMHEIMGTLMNDVCTTCFCGQLAICQLKRDIDYTKSIRMEI